MRFTIARSLALVAISCVSSFAGQVVIGNLAFLPGFPNSGLDGFLVSNETGPAPNGCSAASLTPVCTVLALANTQLTITYVDVNNVQQTVNRIPTSGFSFGPGTWLYGSGPLDDASQSFTLDPSQLAIQSLVSATFSGTISPDSFQVTDSDSNGVLSQFFSTGFFSVTLDISSVDIDQQPVPTSADIVAQTTDQPPPSVPEPGSLALAAAGIGFLGWRGRAQKSRAN